MRRLWVLLCLLVPLAGCVDQPRNGQSPIAGPPKLVVNYGPDNLTEMYVHASVGEINYTSVTLRLDNATAGQPGYHHRNESYSIDVKTNRTAFHVNVTVRDDPVVYTYAANMEVNLTRRPPDLMVRPLGGDETASDLPYSTTLDQWKREES